MVLNNVQNVETHIFATQFAMQLGRKSLVSIQQDRNYCGIAHLHTLR